MKLVYLSGSRIPARDANSVHTMKICAAFAALGHDVVLVCGAGDGEGGADHEFYGVPPSFEIVKLPWPRVKGGAVVYGLASYRFLRGCPGFDLAISRSPYAVWGCPRLGLPFVYETHAPPRTPVHRAMERRLVASPSCLRVVTVSRALQRYYLERYQGKIGVEVAMVPDAADPIPATGEVMKMDLPGRAGALRVGYVGHIYAGRGLEVIVHLADRLDAIDFHVVGGSPDHHAAAANGSGPPNLHWHGFVPPARVPSILLSLDVALAPYQRRVLVTDGVDTVRWMSPLKIFEYMAAGRAIVASDLPALREILADRHTALLVDPEDLDGWVRAVRSLDRDRSMRSALGEAARRTFEASYTWRERARRLLPR